MRILHLSDFHLRGDGGLSFRVVDTLECLRVAADHLKTLVQKPDALVITGDLADSGDAHAYSLLHEALAPLSLPVYVVILLCIFIGFILVSFLLPLLGIISSIG